MIEFFGILTGLAIGITTVFCMRIGVDMGDD